MTMNYYHETTHIRPRVHCADGVSLSIQASEYACCLPRQRIQRPWDFYTLVEVGYIYDKDTQPFSPPDIWRPYRSGDDEIWAYIPVPMVREFIEAHGGAGKPNSTQWYACPECCQPCDVFYQDTNTQPPL